MAFYPVKFQPIPTERLWGGHRLKAWFGCEQLAQPVGEYWLVSAHPSATSVAVNGPLAGHTLTELTTRYPEVYLGVSPQPRFPLLVKVIEASADLSVQVHPDDAYAAAHEQDFGKAEAWYVLEAPADGRVVFGHRFSDREAYFAAVKNGRVRDYLRYQEIAPGQVLAVPAGTLHALLAGTAVIEIQQTSDLTYRVYDWDRVDAHGQPRALHVEKAADVLDYQKGTPEASPVVLLTAAAGVRHEQLLRCPHFTIEKITVHARPYTLPPRKGNPTLLIAVHGDGLLRFAQGEQPLGRGEAVLVPATITEVELCSGGELTVLQVFY